MKNSNVRLSEAGISNGSCFGFRGTLQVTGTRFFVMRHKRTNAHKKTGTRPPKPETRTIDNNSHRLTARMTGGIKPTNQVVVSVVHRDVCDLNCSDRGRVSKHLRTLIHVSIFNITHQLKLTAAGSNDRTYDSRDYTDEEARRKSGFSRRRLIIYWQTTFQH